MKRKIYNDLLKWKNKQNRKPLILDGARQVGKTWILREFGQNEYENVAYINCDNNPVMQTMFNDFDIDRIIKGFCALTNKIIKPNTTLIILDEIQEIPLALTSLKYFYELASEYHIIVAGSLLGITLHQGTGFPVGKVETLKMYPMTFNEFLIALGNDYLEEITRMLDFRQINMLHPKYEELLRLYYYIGGMPEVVSYYIQTNDILGVREIQNRILDNYQSDFSKHIPKALLSKVRLVWQSIPSQLAKENKKYIYRMIKTGARAKEYEDAIQWLLDTGLVYKVNRVNKIEKPIKFYEDFNSFKLFILDLGLLGAMVDVDVKDVIIGNNVFSEYKGMFSEQYVAQQMQSCNIKIYYYSKENSTLEIDFLLQKEIIYTIEVKAEANVKSKSLKTVCDTNDNLTGIRFSMQPYIQQSYLTNIPLYLVYSWAFDLTNNH